VTVGGECCQRSKVQTDSQPLKLMLDLAPRIFSGTKISPLGKTSNRTSLQIYERGVSSTHIYSVDSTASSSPEGSLRSMFSSLIPGGKIVELGARGGYWAHHLHAFGADIVAVDPGSNTHPNIPWFDVQFGLRGLDGESWRSTRSDDGLGSINSSSF